MIPPQNEPSTPRPQCPKGIKETCMAPAHPAVMASPPTPSNKARLLPCPTYELLVNQCPKLLDCLQKRRALEPRFGRRRSAGDTRAPARARAASDKRPPPPAAPRRRRHLARFSQPLVGRVHVQRLQRPLIPPLARHHARCRGGEGAAGERAGGQGWAGGPAGNR